jgi:hypothetical protein
VFQVDVPFLLQQAQYLYEKQLEELQLQMQRVNSSTSVLGHSKGHLSLSLFLCVQDLFVLIGQIQGSHQERVDNLICR